MPQTPSHGKDALHDSPFTLSRRIPRPTKGSKPLFYPSRVRCAGPGVGGITRARLPLFILKPMPLQTLTRTSR